MDKIYDYILLLFYGLILSVFIPFNLHTIIAFLLAIIFTSLFYLYEKKQIVYLLILLFLLLTFIGFPIITFTPLILYAVSTHPYKVSISVVTLLVGISASVDWKTIMFLLFGYLLAYCLSYKTNAYQALDTTYRQTRDDGVEKNLLLTEKYNALRKSQDNEIYTATLQERNRIAREIHDNVGHLLSRAMLMLGAVKVLTKDTTIEPQLLELHTTLSGAMDSIRTSVHRLHDDSIDLQTTMQTLLENTLQIRFDMDYDMSNHIPKEIKYCIIAITKEALNNMVKHSDANSVKLVVREHPMLYQLIIHDNGSTAPLFLTNTQSLPTNGIGLENMSERIRTFHGTIQFSYSHGFKIFITIPKGSM